LRRRPVVLKPNSDTAPIVLSLFAWSRRFIAVFIALGCVALGWSLGDLQMKGYRVWIDTAPLWPLIVLGSCAAVVAMAVAFRVLARRIDSQLRYLGSLDALTGLSNRSGVMDRLERPHIAVLYLDLDKFKGVNDSLGHDAGDEVLRTVASRIRRLLRPSDMAARLGGDEFVVVVEDPDVKTAAKAMAERIREALAAPVRVDRRPISVTSSIGVAIKSAELSTGQELLRAADLALYRAKRQGRNRVVLFNDAVEANLIHRLDLEKGLWQAMDRGELELFYLPEVNLQTGAIVGAEALVRWQHPDHGLLRADSFIAIAEEAGSLPEIGLWAVETACREWGELQNLTPGRGPVTMSVNVSPHQIMQPDFARRVEGVLVATGMDPRYLKLEMPERVLTDVQSLQSSQMDALRKLGIRMIIDEFGTGHAPLSYLRQAPVQGVKIDRTLVTNLEFDDSKLLVVQAVIALARDLGLEVTAVGIETPGQLSELHDLGCEVGQGFYLSEPVRAEDLKRLVSRRPANRLRNPRRAA
jgi:diguanylate cyclase (GGDEF)-like protein